MSELIDIMVTPDMLNNKQILISGCVSVRYLQTITLPVPTNNQMSYFSWDYHIANKTPSSILLPVIVTAGNWWMQGGGGVVPFRINNIAKLAVNGDVVRAEIESIAWGSRQEIPNSGVIDVYEILTNDTQERSDFGLLITDGVDWTQFNSTSEICAMVHRETVVINGAGWVLPPHIGDRRRCIIFGDWSSSDSAIQYDSLNYKISRIGADIEVDIYVFSVGANLTTPTVGIAVYNEMGNITFSSENVPIIYPNTEFNPKRNAQLLPHTKNLVQIRDYGHKVDTELDRVLIRKTALMKIGNRANLVRGDLIFNDQTKIGIHDIEFVSSNLMVLDGNKYGN
ncbi:DUF6453 family protein [Pectobacterium wasabiae]|uniref:Baseplate protein n=1 Tax=Pectobacterium wasabiae TaxID=55208 RepID=A0AAW3EQB4_9GAMM|nr:DUF6453 family protein [Pectobacterium wasabiae]AOR64873.1 hypothetical protein A7983_16750 [Pectobacterium wasabiae CFBP 3304]EJS96297.1 Hypothetical protein Y17_0173 [Pectobacterium wasabiae CFBP 3304]KFX09860.1 hypothetical protein JV38_02755 [Pectobacterium wasabiae]KGA30062.1 hypothetical protein KU73_06480 [Pectobacterium wasabiae]